MTIFLFLRFSTFKEKKTSKLPKHTMKYLKLFKEHGSFLATDNIYKQVHISLGNELSFPLSAEVHVQKEDSTRWLFEQWEVYVRI